MKTILISTAPLISTISYCATSDSIKIKTLEMVIAQFFDAIREADGDKAARVIHQNARLISTSVVVNGPK